MFVHKKSSNKPSCDSTLSWHQHGSTAVNLHVTGLLDFWPDTLMSLTSWNIIKGSIMYRWSETDQLVSISAVKQKHLSSVQIHLFVFTLVVDILKAVVLTGQCHYCARWHGILCVLETERWWKQLRSVLWKELWDGHQRETQSNIQATAATM